VRGGPRADAAGAPADEDRGMDIEMVLLFVMVWVVPGLVIGLWMARRGHDPRWTAVAVLLGPLFIPIAVERVERRPRLALSSSGGLEAPASTGPGPRVLVGLDSSAESRAVLTEALELLGARCGLLMLAEVVDFDAPEDDRRGKVAEARTRLSAATAAARDAGVEARFEVLAGPPAATLRRFAETQEIDLLVVGRRGRGRSPRLLGRVSDDLVHRSRVPVMVVEPQPRAGGPAAKSRADVTPQGV